MKKRSVVRAHAGCKKYLSAKTTILITYHACAVTIFLLRTIDLDNPLVALDFQASSQRCGKGKHVASKHWQEHNDGERAPVRGVASSLDGVGAGAMVKHLFR